MTHERAGRLLAGVCVAGASALAWLHHPAWLAVLGMIGLNLAISAVTGRCAVKTLLIRLGFPGERELGVGEGLRLAANAGPGHRRVGSRRIAPSRTPGVTTRMIGGHSDAPCDRN